MRLPRGSELVAGIGDDCAVVRPRGVRADLLFTTDLLLENVHFRRATHPPEVVGRKALARGLSDLAAMGGEPRFCLLSLVAPFAFRRILDHSIPTKNRSEITVLASIVVIAAIVDAVLSIVQRWYSARIGEGLIFDLRAALYDHVQRMPLAFFTRTQTGALQSRLNNDVIGAQQAVTTTLGTVVSNVINLAVVLTIMLSLEWRLTLLAICPY